MTMKYLLLIICFGLACKGSSALDWNLSVKKSGSKLYACSNDTVFFPYLFSLSESESIVSMTWTYHGNHESKSIGSLLLNDFMTTRHYFNKVTLDENGNLTMQNVGIQDTGRYLLKIQTQNKDQIKKMYTKELSLAVSKHVMYKGNNMIAKLSDKADWNSDTESFSLSLTCGDFIFKDDNAPIDVEWVTPGGIVKNSTKYVDGKFYLQLDNPIEDSQFVCKIPQRSISTVCATSNDNTQVTVSVDEDKARIILLENENKKIVKQILSFTPVGCEDLQSFKSDKKTIYTAHFQPVTIYCDQDTDGGRWNVFQRRRDGSLYFYREWHEHRNGFGDPNFEFWLGLEALHQMTKDGRTYELRFDLEKQDGSKYYAVYDDFSIGSESEGYAVHFTGYRGNAGDSFSYSKDMKFTARDRDLDHNANANCAVVFMAGWWYNDCHESQLNGHYNQIGNGRGLYWKTLNALGKSLKKTEMKFRVSFKPDGCEDFQSFKSDQKTIYLPRIQPVTIYCDQDTDGGRWNVFQRRQDGSVNFYKGWSDYRNGFGDPDKEFWLGLETLHLMTSNERKYELRFDLTAQNGSKYYAVYDDFSIGSESEGYAVHFTGYRGNAGDSFSYHKDMKFTTKDRDNDITTISSSNCAVIWQGAWWYKKCHQSNLNGNYGDKTFAKGVNWSRVSGYYESLKKTEMKFRVKQ